MEQKDNPHEILREEVLRSLSLNRIDNHTALSRYCTLVHVWMQRQGFWESDNFGEKIALIHSELSEALEASRKNLLSDHVPNMTGVEEELADTLIRLFDLCGHLQIDVEDVIRRKMQFNLDRPFKHGKKF